MTGSLLTDRLNHLMGCLDQDGRHDDAALVNEAILALSKPAVVGTPWTTPLKGDRCTRVDGKSREATMVGYRRSVWLSERNGPLFTEEPRRDYYPDRIDYRDEKGREHGCAASSWATWCRAACKAGGTYVRTEPSPQP